MTDSFLKIVRSKSKKEWNEVGRKLLALLREILQKNGEVSALLGLTAGIVVVLLFQWIVFFAVLGILIFWVIYILAQDD